jgi:hypothetical protein
MNKSPAQYSTETGPRLQPTGHSGLLHTVGQNSHEAAAWRLSPAGKTARGNACAPRARGEVTAHVRRVRWRGGALDGGAVGAGRRQGAAGEHRWVPGEAPGKKSGDEAHRGGRATVGRRKTVGAAVFNGGGVAPVVVDVRGEVLQHRCKRGKMGLAPI